MEFESLFYKTFVYMSTDQFLLIMFDPDDHGDWKSREACDCAWRSGNYKVLKAYHLSIKQLNIVTNVAWDAFRGLASIFTGGISDKYNGGLAAATHDVVEYSVHCDYHGVTFPVTFDITSNGKRMRIGEFTKYSVNRQYTYSGKPMGDILDVYNKLSGDFCSVNWNSEHFADRLYAQA